MDLERLTKEMGWVRRLAGAIIKDDALADDVAQETWIIASQHAPEDRPLRPWLHRVVLNLVRMGTRSATRRRARELATDISPVATPIELAERVATSVRWRTRCSRSVSPIERSYCCSTSREWRRARSRSVCRFLKAPCDGGSRSRVTSSSQN